MIKGYFFIEGGPVEPLGATEYWLEAVPRVGEAVMVVYVPPQQPDQRRHFHGEVVAIEWLFDEGEVGGRQYSCAVDVTLRERPNPSS